MLLDCRADVYSFGCVVFELLSGKPPFTGTNADELLNKHLTGAVPNVQVYNENVTPEFANVIKKMMAKKREERKEKPFDLIGFAVLCGLCASLRTAQATSNACDRPTRSRALRSC